MSTTKIKPQNLATPGTPMSREEFVSLIQQAEKGTFKSIANLKKEVLSVWKKKVRKVVRSEQILNDLAAIYQYGLETFGVTTAETFLEEINHTTDYPTSIKCTLNVDSFLPTDVRKNSIFCLAHPFSLKGTTRDVVLPSGS